MQRRLEFSPAAGAEALFLDEALAGVALLDEVSEPGHVLVDLGVPARQGGSHAGDLRHRLERDESLDEPDRSLNFTIRYGPLRYATLRYAGLLLAPAEGFGLRPRLFCPSGKKKGSLCGFGPFLAIVGVQ